MKIDFDCQSSVSVNSLAVNKTNVSRLQLDFFRKNAHVRKTVFNEFYL